VRKSLRKLNPTLKCRDRVFLHRCIFYGVLLFILIVRLAFSFFYPSDLYLTFGGGRAVSMSSPWKAVYVTEEYYPGDVLRIIKTADGYQIEPIYSDIRRDFWKSRKHLAESQMKGDVESLFFGMVGGFQVPYNIREKLASYGMAHLLAVSGTHIDATAAVLYFLGFPVFLLVATVIFYGFLVGFSPSIIRAIVFMLFLLVYRFTGEKRVDILSLVITTTLVVAIFVPAYVFSVSYILSISVSVAIIYSLSERKYDVMLWVIWGLSIWYFSRLTLFSLVFPLVSPIFTAFMIVAMMWLLVPWRGFAYVINTVLGFISHLPILPFPFDIYLPSYWAFLFLGLVIVRTTRTRWVKYVGIFLIMFPFLLSATLLYVFPARAVFVNVGEGDSILLRNSNITMLVDSGRPYPWVVRNIHEAMRRVGINNIDLVLLTHDDADHVGGFERYINRMDKYRYMTVLRGWTVCRSPVSIGRDIQIIFMPCKEEWKDNERSTVVYFHGILLMADQEKRGLSYFLSHYHFYAPVLKMPHHGAYDDHTEDLVKQTAPFDAIISVGKNIYGHPKKRTLEILRSYHVRIHRTDSEGTLVVLVKRDGSHVIVPLRCWWLRALKYIV